MKLRFCALGTLCVVFCLWAGEPPSAELERLRRERASAMTQVEMNQAEAEYAAYWDRLLATEEVKFLATCDEKRAQLFHRAQQAWRAHLSADADLAADKARGGTMSAMIHAGRRASMIERRVEFLRDLAYEP